MNRMILHVDANSFYASVECLYDPAIRDKPVAVSGEAESRHGIILTKNQIAKQYGVQTGEAIWQARQKCPDLICVPPDYAKYTRWSQRMRDILTDYSNRIEPFGLDESWADISAQEMTIEKGEALAHVIRERIKMELGITVSIGVSFNKVFAKLGSDMKKPDAVTVISQGNYRQKVCPLPVEELLFVGPATRRKLAQFNIQTIGELAQCSPMVLQKRLGKNGLLLRAFANGEECSPVMPIDGAAAVKSIGNSTTPPHDLRTLEDARCIFFVLGESVAARLRETGFKARCVGISARTTELKTTTRQCILPEPSCLTNEIVGAAMALFEAHYAKSFPYRSVGLQCTMLCDSQGPVQLDLMGREIRRLHLEKLEASVDELRRRYGHQAVRRGVELTDERYAQVNPKEDQLIHPVGVLYKG
ncbi:MAG: DNA polymerase IV [Clostridia bacterium]|nr:DNA polymerase IV [Clostridia bacterium]